MNLPRYADHELIAQLKALQPATTFRTWESTALATKKACGGLCCYPGCWKRGSAAHHAAYQDNDGAIVGRELAGVHVFWLCRTHHSKKNRDGAHHPMNWFPGKVAIEARNTIAYYKLLREGYQEKKAKCRHGSTRRRCKTGLQTS